MGYYTKIKDLSVLTFPEENAELFLQQKKGESWYLINAKDGYDYIFYDSQNNPQDIDIFYIKKDDTYISIDKIEYIDIMNNEKKIGIVYSFRKRTASQNNSDKFLIKIKTTVDDVYFKYQCRKSNYEKIYDINNKKYYLSDLCDNISSWECNNNTYTKQIQLYKYFQNEYNICFPCQNNKNYKISIENNKNYNILLKKIEPNKTSLSDSKIEKLTKDGSIKQVIPKFPFSFVGSGEKDGVWYVMQIVKKQNSDEISGDLNINIKLDKIKCSIEITEPNMLEFVEGDISEKQFGISGYINESNAANVFIIDKYIQVSPGSIYILYPKQEDVYKPVLPYNGQHYDYNNMKPLSALFDVKLNDKSVSNIGDNIFIIYNIPSIDFISRLQITANSTYNTFIKKYGYLKIQREKFQYVRLWTWSDETNPGEITIEDINSWKEFSFISEYDEDIFCKIKGLNTTYIYYFKLVNLDNTKTQIKFNADKSKYTAIDMSGYTFTYSPSINGEYIVKITDIKKEMFLNVIDSIINYRYINNSQNNPKPFKILCKKSLSNGKSLDSAILYNSGKIQKEKIYRNNNNVNKKNISISNSNQLIQQFKNECQYNKACGIIIYYKQSSMWDTEDKGYIELNGIIQSDEFQEKIKNTYIIFITDPKNNCNCIETYNFKNEGVFGLCKKYDKFDDKIYFDIGIKEQYQGRKLTLNSSNKEYTGLFLGYDGDIEDEFILSCKKNEIWDITLSSENIDKIEFKFDNQENILYWKKQTDQSNQKILRIKSKAADINFSIKKLQPLSQDIIKYAIKIEQKKIADIKISSDNSNKIYKDNMIISYQYDDNGNPKKKTASLIIQLQINDEIIEEESLTFKILTAKNILSTTLNEGDSEGDSPKENVSNLKNIITISLDPANTKKTIYITVQKELINLLISINCETDGYKYISAQIHLYYSGKYIFFNDYASIGTGNTYIYCKYIEIISEDILLSNLKYELIDNNDDELINLDFNSYCIYFEQINRKKYLVINNNTRQDWVPDNLYIRYNNKSKFKINSNTDQIDF